MDRKNIEKAGKGLANIVARVSFTLWEKEEFRQLISFDTIEKTEQDRIFNEIEVTFLGLFSLYFENLARQLEDKSQKETMKLLRVALKAGFLGIYKDLSLPTQNINQWSTLITMRLKEYEEDFRKLMKEGETIKKFQQNTGAKIGWARIETITLDGISHIRRGKLDENDPLRKYFHQWVIDVDTLFSQSIKQVVFKPQGTA